MSRLLYLKDRLGIHDERFLSALRAAGHLVRSAHLDGKMWNSEGRTASIEELLVDSPVPDAVQVGPLPLAGIVAEAISRHPLIAVCWGSDGFVALTPAERRALREASVVITDCSLIVERLVDAGAARERVHHFAWGIDLELFHPPESHTASFDTAKQFVATRALEPLYRYPVVLRALRTALDRGLDCRLSIYGNGSEGEALRDLVARLDLGEHVAFFDPVPERDLAEVFREATAWVNAARTDGISISLLQALACGAGAVTTDLECAREAAGTAEVHFFPRDDDHALATALIEVDRPEREAAADTRGWLEHFADWKRNAERYVAAVERAL